MIPAPHVSEASCATDIYACAVNAWGFGMIWGRKLECCGVLQRLCGCSLACGPISSLGMD